MLYMKRAVSQSNQVDTRSRVFCKTTAMSTLEKARIGQIHINYNPRDFVKTKRKLKCTGVLRQMACRKCFPCFTQIIICFITSANGHRGGNAIK